MIIYLLKTILCSGLLLLAYYLLLEKEKMHHFNRFYLLFSIVASFVIPMIMLPVPAKIFSVTETVAPLDVAVFDAPEVADNPTPQLVKPAIIESRHWWPALLSALYLAVSAVLLCRFLRNLLTITIPVRQNPVINHSGARLVLTNNPHVPHTFLHYIFLYKNDYENGFIQKEVLCHEMVHVRQKHSVDILLIELLLIVFWVNPVLYFYRKAIRLNHEFLADDAVIETFKSPVIYQRLLLQSASRPGTILPTSPFNYSITKKRLIMMTKNKSPKIAFAKQIAVFQLMAAMVLLFSMKVTGQQNTGKPDAQQDTTLSKEKILPQKSADSVSSSWNRLVFSSTKEGVAPELLTEYENIIKKYETEGKWWHSFSKRVSEQDRNRMETIFKQMNLEQQQKQFLIFLKPIGPSPKAIPTPAQFAAFKNPKIYGLWINGKHVSNTALNNYTNTDFAQFGVSKLYGAAKKGRSYTHQLNMMTKDYYQNYYNQAMANRQSLIGFTFNNHPVDSIRQKFRSRFVTPPYSKASVSKPDTLEWYELQTKKNDATTWHPSELSFYGSSATLKQLHKYYPALKK